MNVNEMTTQEKTIKLATLCQWEISEVDEQWRVWVKAPDFKYSTTDLYQEWAMFLAWRVHCWVNEVDTPDNTKKHLLFIKYSDWVETKVKSFQFFEAGFMQTAMDKILELAIEAGVIE